MEVFLKKSQEKVEPRCSHDPLHVKRIENGASNLRQKLQ